MDGQNYFPIVRDTWIELFFQVRKIWNVSFQLKKTKQNFSATHRKTNKRHTHIHRAKDTYAYIQKKHRQIDRRAHRIADKKTKRRSHTDTKTKRHTEKQVKRLRHTRTDKQKDTHAQKHVQTHRHKYWQTKRHTHTDIQKRRQRHRKNTECYGKLSESKRN